MRYNVSLIDHARLARRTLVESTQEIRAELICQLVDMFRLAFDYAKAKKGVTPKQRELFMRVMAYIAQVLNSLTESFDEAALTKDLEELEKMINEAVPKTEDTATQGTSATASGS